jgi:hypothetical protein
MTQILSLVKLSVAVMGAGQTAEVDKGNVITITDTPPAPAGFYNIHNNTSIEHTCGLVNPSSSCGTAPIWALPLFGNSTVSIKPIEKIFLCFANDLSNHGTVWAATTTPGIVIDVEDPAMLNFTVTFDINLGCWSSTQSALWGSNVTPIDSGTPFDVTLNATSSKE